MSSSSSDDSDSVENVEKTTLFILPSINGVPGRNGPAGPAGPAGATGASGPAGATGASGPAGVATSCLRSFVVSPQTLNVGVTSLTLTPGPLPNGSAECPCITFSPPNTITLNVAAPFVVKIDGSVTVRIPPNADAGQIEVHTFIFPATVLTTNVMSAVEVVPTTRVIAFPFNISPIFTSSCPSLLFEVFHSGGDALSTEVSTITLEILPASTPTCTVCPP